eukprot:7390026-Prymnesium_polylepis.2
MATASSRLTVRAPQRFVQRCTATLCLDHHSWLMLARCARVLCFAEARGVLSFTAIHLTPEEREKNLLEADSINHDGKFNRAEFLDLCVRVLWEQPLTQLQAAAENYANAKAMRLRRTNARWVKVADTIDRECRLWVVGIYTSMLSYLFLVNFDDDAYAQPHDPPGKTSGMLPMITGLLPMRLEDGSLTGALVVVMVVIILFLAHAKRCVDYCEPEIEMMSDYSKKLAAEVAERAEGASKMLAAEVAECAEGATAVGHKLMVRAPSFCSKAMSGMASSSEHRGSRVEERRISR